MSLDEYLHRHAMNGVYADDLIIHCTATFLGKDIFVVTEQNKDIWRHMNSHVGTKGIPITLASSQSAKKDQLGRYITGGEHFQSLIPVDEEEKDVKTCRNCGQKNLKRLKSHFNNAKKNCSRMYDLNLMNDNAKAKAQQKK